MEKPELLGQPSRYHGTILSLKKVRLGGCCVICLRGRARIPGHLPPEPVLSAATCASLPRSCSEDLEAPRTQQSARRKDEGAVVVLCWT